MGVFGTSAMGEKVDFDLLKIKQQLASNPVSVNIQNRRKVIDVKNGLKPRESQKVYAETSEVKMGLKEISAAPSIDTSNETVNDALALALSAAKISASENEEI